MLKAVYILIAIVMLGFIIMIHEFGHYLVGRLCGMAIKEFSVGFGPRIFGFERKGIKYSFRAIILGGYCSFLGEDDSDSDPRAMRNQPVWKRFLTIFAGPFMNFVLAFVFCVVFLCCYQTAEYLPRVAEIAADSPAQECGLENNDIITSVDGVDITYDMNGVTAISQALSEADLSQPVDITILRNGETVSVLLVPALQIDEDGKESYSIGIYLGSRTYRFPEALGSSCTFMYDITAQMLTSLKDLIFHGEGADEMMGTVGIISFVSDTVRSEHLRAVIWLIFILSLDIGLMNLLPVPALDGGRIFFLIIEMIRRKPIPPEKEGIVHLVGFALLMLLFVFITYKDIIRLISGG